MLIYSKESARTEHIILHHYESTRILVEKRSRFLNSGFILVSISHALNHAYESLLPILYPLLLSEFGLSYSLIGVISLGYRLSGGLLQLLMGFLGRFFRRT